MVTVDGAGAETFGFEFCAGAGAGAGAGACAGACACCEEVGLGFSAPCKVVVMV
jgi:hypothetical protein